MQYQINEGVFEAIGATRDDSVNIINFLEQKATLAITRTALQANQTVGSYIDQQLAVVKRENKRFLLGERQVTTLSEQAQLPATEITLQFEKNKATIYQHLLAAQLPGQHLLVMTYAQTRPFSKTDLEHWQGIKNSFTPNKSE